MVKGGPAVESLDDALRLLRSSRQGDRKAATEWLGEATNDAKARAAITKAGRCVRVVLGCDVYGCICMCGWIGVNQSID